MQRNKNIAIQSQVGRHGWQAVVVTIRPAELSRDVLPLDEAALGQAAAECGNEVRRILRRPRARETDHRYRRLLPARCERPYRRATKERDESAPPHSITSSAVASNLSGSVIPSALAVLRLITNSNLSTFSTGKSAGAAPLSTRPT